MPTLSKNDRINNKYKCFCCTWFISKSRNIWHRFKTISTCLYCESVKSLRYSIRKDYISLTAANAISNVLKLNSWWNWVTICSESNGCRMQTWFDGQMKILSICHQILLIYEKYKIKWQSQVFRMVYYVNSLYRRSGVKIWKLRQSYNEWKVCENGFES